ncbi:MAG: hypothetical protein QXE05_00045 [Nitrososphaeria archaeon]
MPTKIVCYRCWTEKGKEYEETIFNGRPYFVRNVQTGGGKGFCPECGRYGYLLKLSDRSKD